MRVLNISLDKNALFGESKFTARILEYSELVEKYIVLVPGRGRKELTLSPKSKIISSGGSNKLMLVFGVFLSACRIIKNEKINIISVQDQYFLGLASLIIAQIKNIALEVQVHGFEKYSGIRKFVSKFVLPRADSVRTVSERLKKRLIDEFKVDKEKITVVPIYIKVESQPACPADRKSTPLQYELASRQEVKSNERIIFFTAGRMVSVKNFSMQIKAMAEVVKKYPNAELWIAGDGEELDNIKLQITNYILQDNIKLLGWQSDLSKFYQEADVFMLTSFAEGWPLVIVEAAGYGLPIIMTDVGSAGELIIHNESGLVVPVNDTGVLVGAMTKLIEDNSLRERLGANARKQIESQPSKVEIFNLYKKSWEKALNFFNKNKILIWPFLLVLIFLFCVPSIYRIWQIKYLYSDKTIQSQAISSMGYFRSHYGYGATDLNLEGIIKLDNGYLYKYTYNYHQPNLESPAKQKKYQLFFEKGVVLPKEVKQL